MIISLNGSLCDEKEAVVSAYDHGFLYGMGLFETFRTYQGKAFLLEEHLERLAGCRELAIQLEISFPIGSSKLNSYWRLINCRMDIFAYRFLQAPIYWDSQPSLSQSNCNPICKAIASVWINSFMMQGKSL